MPSAIDNHNYRNFNQEKTLSAMYRSFSNRLFAGVCGGLANSTPLNAWLWRLIFIILALLTMGTGALIYVMMWWLLPLDSPLHNREGGSLPGLIAVLVSVLLIGLYVGRNALDIASVYPGIAVLILAIVFLLKQIFTGRLQNIAIALVFLAIPTIFLLDAYEILQAGILDILIRSAPAVLIFLGLTIAMRYRVRFGSWIALIISIALIAGLASYAYSSRVDVVSTSNLIERLIPDEENEGQAEISETVTILLVEVRTGDTDVTITVNDDANRVIQANFEGSNNSVLNFGYSENESGEVAEMFLRETQASEFPLLEDIGRGRLTLEIPPDIAVGVTFNGERGEEISLDMGGLNLERLNFTMEEGDVLVRLPEYQPQSPSVVDSNGTWDVQNGNLRVIAPEELGLRLSFTRSTNAEPSNFNDLIYQLLIEGGDIILASRGFDTLDTQMQYRIDVSGGQFTLESPE